mgnify:CR=1 FL=1
MRIDELTQEVLDDIFKIYKKTTGSVEDRFPNIDSVRDYIEKFGFFEYRAGSSLSGHSKFVIEVEDKLKFYLSPNCECSTRKESRKAEKIRDSFDRAVKNYMAENNLG